MASFYIAKAHGFGDSVSVVRAIKRGGASIDNYRWFPSDRAPVHHFARQFATQGAADKALGAMVSIGGYDDYAVYPIAELTAGQIAYDEDCKRAPCYANGKARASWDALCEVARQSWERNPTARDWSAAA